MIITCHCFFHPAKKLRSGAIVRFSDNSSFFCFSFIASNLIICFTVKGYGKGVGENQNWTSRASFKTLFLSIF